MFKINKVASIKRIIDSSEKLQKIYVLILLLTMLGSFLMALGAIYLIPNAFDVWYSLVTLDFKKVFYQLSQPTINYKEYISLTFELLLEIGLVLIFSAIIMFLCVLLLYLYKILLEKFINKQLISILKNYGYLIFEQKYSLELKNTDSNKYDVSCELCGTECMNLKYTHRLYTEKEIDKLARTDELKKSNHLPTLDNYSVNKCKYKWSRKIISVADSNNKNRGPKIKKGDIMVIQKLMS
jgi:hypothetical protein